MGYYRKVDTAQNLLRYSHTISSWSLRGGTETITDNNTVSPDDTQNASKVESLGAQFNSDIWRQDTGFGANSRYEPSCWIKKISSTGVLRIDDPLGTGGSAGVWTVDFSNLSAEWEYINRSHNAVTVVEDFVSASGGSGGVHLYALSGGPLDLYLWGAQAQLGAYSTTLIPTSGSPLTAAVRRDNHWSKDHNGIWRRSLKLEGPRNGYSEWTNLIDYSAGPFYDSPGGLDFWDSFSTIAGYENVASCIEGGTALHATSTVDGAPRLNYQTGTFSGNIEVISGIFERGDTNNDIMIGAWGNPVGTNYLNRGYDFDGDFIWGSDFGTAVTVDSGYEDLGIGPNGGQLIRLWCAYDTSVSGFVGESRYNQWRPASLFSGTCDGILHHAQLYEIPSGYSSSDNGASTGPIVNLTATNNSINRESFSIPISFNPQAHSVYIRFKQMWRDGQHTAFSIGGSVGERLKLENSNGATGTYFFRHHDGSTYVQDVGFGVGVDFGDTVEFAGVLNSDGSVQAWESVNGAAWVEGTASGALTFTGSWGENLVHLGSIDDSNNGQGFIELEAFKIVDTAISDAAGADWLRGYKETGTREY